MTVFLLHRHAHHLHPPTVSVHPYIGDHILSGRNENRIPRARSSNPASSSPTRCHERHWHRQVCTEQQQGNESATHAQAHGQHQRLHWWQHTPSPARAAGRLLMMMMMVMKMKMMKMKAKVSMMMMMKVSDEDGYLVMKVIL